MRIDYFMPLSWFALFRNAPALADAVGQAKAAGLGLEIGNDYLDESRGIFRAPVDPAVRDLLRGIPHSHHCADTGHDPEIFRQVVDCAAEYGTRCVVVHPRPLKVQQWEVAGESPCELPVDYDFANRVVEYATGRKVTVVLENNVARRVLEDQVRALAKVSGLRICFDIGHAHVSQRRYPGAPTVRDFVDALKQHVAHVHLDVHRLPFWQDNITAYEWRDLFEALEEVDFEGAMLFESAFPGPLAVAEFDLAAMKHREHMFLTGRGYAGFNR